MRYKWNILVRILLQTAALFALSFFLLKGWWLYAALMAPVVLFLLAGFYRFVRNAQIEVEEFAEAVHYRDFSRNFNIRQAPFELRPLRKGFNEINSTFKMISREKETQFHYLQKILELVDTGILSYETESGTIAWMNDAFKKLLNIPYLKTIHSLEKRNSSLYQQLQSLKNEESRIISVTKDKSTFKALLSTTTFQTDGRRYKLIAFQNVSEALDENESQAWQKLLSVMTHEIMNSIAPISSLAETLKKRLQQTIRHDPGEWRPGNFEDLELGIDTIKRRSEGLLKFAETYRNLNKISKPQLKKVYVRDLFENLHQLMEPTLVQKRIEMDIILKDPSIALDIDASLIEQVLINLVLNAGEALKYQDAPRIILSAGYGENKKVYITVTDNGTGMAPEILDKIFVPFFTTKKNGNGIGLSLCKQIMMLHEGSLQVQTIEGEGTTFILRF